MSEQKKINAVQRYADKLIDSCQSEVSQVAECIEVSLYGSYGDTERSRCALVVASLCELRDAANAAIIEVVKAAQS